jgi:hypothetical protein
MRIEFRHQAVRDLAWVIGSPSLLGEYAKGRVTDSWCRLAFYDRIPWLRVLDRRPDDLLAWLEQRKSHLLGYYFESLIEYWLAHWPRMSLCSARLPLTDGKRVIGEFDFLFRDRFLGIDYHWETAVKFFLRYRYPGDESEWLGPNPRDTWQRKCTKVFEHQLILSVRPQARVLLQRLGMAAPQPKAFFKGYLFTHFAQASADAELAPAMSPVHLGGWWCHFGEVEALPQNSTSSRWLSLPRLHWLSPAYSRDKAPGMTRKACLAMLATHFDGSQKPLLLAEIVQGSDGIWRESQRGFVVADDWPGSAFHRGGTIAPHD